MQNILAAATQAMKNLLNDSTKAPLHIGEAMSFWTYLTALAEANAYETAALNTTQDEELIRQLHAARELCVSQIKVVRDFMLDEGIPLPPLDEPKPYSDPSAIPLGVKATESEIANALALKGVTSIIHCSTSMAQSVRPDVGIIWTRLQAEQMIFTSVLKALMAKRGWLKVPPSFNPPGRPHHE